MKKKWELISSEEELVNEISKEYNISKVLARILLNRGVNKKNIKTFLEPNRKDFHDPFLMPDMDKAVERIIKAIEKNEKVIIYGDYDVDGITSTTVLKKFLKDVRVRI